MRRKIAGRACQGIVDGGERRPERTLDLCFASWFGLNPRGEPTVMTSSLLFMRSTFRETTLAAAVAGEVLVPAGTVRRTAWIGRHPKVRMRCNLRSVTGHDGAAPERCESGSAA